MDQQYDINIAKAQLGSAIGGRVSGNNIWQLRQLFEVLSQIDVLCHDFPELSDIRDSIKSVLSKRLAE